MNRRASLSIVLLVLLAAAASLAGLAAGRTPDGPAGTPTAAPTAATSARARAADAAGAPAQAPRPAGPTPTVHAGPEGRVLLGPAWRYRADPGDVGGTQGWQRGFEGRVVSVPHSPNAGSVTGAAGVRNFEGSVGWYRKRFRVARTGRYALRFESVNHRATVWVDGERAGEHVGAYLPFEVRPLLRAGRTHTVTLRADWRSPIEMKRTGWHRGWFNYGGLHREVTLRRVGPSEVEAPNLQTQLVTDAGAPAARVTLSVRVHNREAARVVAPRGSLSRPGQDVTLAFEPQRLRRGQRSVFRAEVRVEQPALWSPEAPTLYDLRVGVPGEEAYRARVGLRELRRRGGEAYLNGRKLFLRGASIHEDAPGRGDALTAADQDEVVRMLRSIGANATRAQHALHPALLERLDAAGIMVWQEIGPWDSPGNWVARTPAMRARGRERIRESVEQLQTHPSIYAWNLGNEIAWNGHPEFGQDVFVDEAAKELHQRDPGRFVAVDIWGIHLPERPGRLYRNLDAVGATNYVGWYEWTFADANKVRSRIRARMEAVRRRFPDKVVVATEFGAEGNRLNSRGRHGSFGYQARLLRANLQTYRQIPDLGGMLIWNLQDFGVNPAFGGGSILRKVAGIRLVPGLNQKGLFDQRGRAKLAARVARQELDRARAERGP